MKVANPSKRISRRIRQSNDLPHLFEATLRNDPDLQWRLQPDMLKLSVDGRNYAFNLHYVLRPSLSDLEKIRTTGRTPTILVVPNLTDHLRTVCRKLELSVADVSGNMWIRAPGLLIEKATPVEQPVIHETEPRNIFVGKSERIIRLLLSNIEKTWTQSEVRALSTASPGLVSRILNHLISQGFIQLTDERRYRVTDPAALLDEWARADDFSRRVSPYAFIRIGGNSEQLAQELVEACQSQEIPIAFTQWIAAWWRRPYAEPAIISAYVERLPDLEVLTRRGFREVRDGGRIVLYVPRDPSVFQPGQVVKGFPVVTDAQIYLDLQRTGFRGPDAARALRDAADFCRSIS